MKSIAKITRRNLLATIALLPAIAGPFRPISTLAQPVTPSSVLPSWNDGPAKQAVLGFVRATPIHPAQATSPRRTA